MKKDRNLYNSIGSIFNNDLLYWSKEKGVVILKFKNNISIELNQIEKLSKILNIDFSTYLSYYINVDSNLQYEYSLTIFFKISVSDVMDIMDEIYLNYNEIIDSEFPKTSFFRLDKAVNNFIIPKYGMNWNFGTLNRIITNKSLVILKNRKDWQYINVLFDYLISINNIDLSSYSFDDIEKYHVVYGIISGLKIVDIIDFMFTPLKNRYVLDTFRVKVNSKLAYMETGSINDEEYRIYYTVNFSLTKETASLFNI